MLIMATLCGCTMLVVATEFMVVGMAPSLSDALSLGPTDYSLFLSSFAMASALAGPVLIVLSRGFSLNTVLAGSLTPFAANIAVLFWPSFELILILRVIQGAALPVLVSLANVILCDRLGTGRGTSLLYVGVVLGGTLAPPASATLAIEFGWQAPFSLLGILSLVGTCVLLTLAVRAAPGQNMDWRRVSGDARLWLHLAVTCFLFMALFASFAHIALFVGKAAGIDPSLGLVLLVFGIGGVIGNWLGGLAEARPLSANALVLCLATASGAAFTWVENLAAIGVMAAALIWGGAHAAAFVIAQVRILQAAPAFRALAGSLNISAGNIGIAIGAYMGGRAITLGGGTEAANLVTACLAATSIAIAAFLARPPRLRSDPAEPADM